jgi:hypothetical protein
MFWKALAVWCAMAAVAIVNGGVRNAFLTPHLGEHAGHVASTITGSIAFLVLIWATLPWIRPSGRRDLVLLGALWLGLTIAFEFLAGHYLFGNTWQRLLEDYNVFHGRVWVAVLLVTFLGPIWMGRLRGIR